MTDHVSPTNGQRNVRIEGTAVPDILRRRRLALGLTGEQVAERCGLSERTVRAIERRHRAAVQERTLLLLAEALELTLPQLLGEAPLPDDGNGDTTGNGAGGAAADGGVATAAARRPCRCWPAAGLVIGLLVAAAAWILLVADIRHPIISYQERDLLISGGVTHRPLARRIFRDRILGAQRAPWDPDQVLVRLGNEQFQRGSLVCLDVRHNRIRWRLSPQQERMRRVFPAEVFTVASFLCAAVTPLDSDGDGRWEVAALFKHVLNFPSSVLLVADDGRVLGQYDHWGYLDQMLVTDLDGDGRQEVAAAGTSNAPGCPGAAVVLLDRDHWSGLSVDPVSCPDAGVADSARVRLVFPNWDRRFWPQVGRIIAASNLRHAATADGPGLIVQLGHPPFSLAVFCDRELQPYRQVLYDVAVAACQAWPDSLRGPGSLLDAGWRRRWALHPYRFECGRLVARPVGAGGSAVAAPAPPRTP